MHDLIVDLREYDDYGHPRLRCPDCGGPLNMVMDSDGHCRRLDTWYCPQAIGEQAYDPERRQRYTPQPSRHTFVRPWHARDQEIAEQLREFGTPGLRIIEACTKVRPRLRGLRRQAA